MIIDTTLREGEQRYGVYFSLDAKKKIFSLLVALGVEEIEIGWISPDPDLSRFISWARERAGSSRLSLWCPARKTDLDIACSLKPDRVNIGVPISIGFGLEHERSMNHMKRVLNHASDLELEYISVGFENAFERMAQAFNAAETALINGAARIRFSDTPGRSTPLKIMDTVKAFNQRFDAPLAIHCHNDFGMATANAVCALALGADFVDTSVLGLGERAGIAATQQVIAHLCLEGNNTAVYRMNLLPELCRQVSREAGENIGRAEPVIGKDIFNCETGIHVQGLSQNPELFFPFDPQKTGTKIRIGLGKKSGRAAVAAVCDSLGPHLPEDVIHQLTSAVRALSNERRRPLTTSEFYQLYRAALSSAFKVMGV